MLMLFAVNEIAGELHALRKGHGIINCARTIIKGEHANRHPDANIRIYHLLQFCPCINRFGEWKVIAWQRVSIDQAVPACRSALKDPPRAS